MNKSIAYFLGAAVWMYFTIQMFNHFSAWIGIAMFITLIIITLNLIKNETKN